MEKYENLGLVGEGSYGIVMKCRNKENGRIVAVKKFLESEDDKTVKKIALREVKMLKQLRHENLVNLLEVCKKKRRWYLVFEFVDHTVLDDLEQYPNGLDYGRVRKYLFQILRAITFCHHHNDVTKTDSSIERSIKIVYHVKTKFLTFNLIIHRDIKPENILISQCGVVKLCDFGFARTMAAPGEVYTDYVATRWYRAPELLVGDANYGKAVDVWAIGCLLVEMLTGKPLFPGDSDIDQLYHIMRCFGNITPRHRELFYKNPVFAGVSLPEIREREPLEMRYPKLSAVVTDLTKKCLQADPDKRPSSSDLLKHEYFVKDGFHIKFTQELNAKIQRDLKDNLSLPKMSKMTKRDKEDSLLDDRKDSNTNTKAKDCKPVVQDWKVGESRVLCQPAETLISRAKPGDLEKAFENTLAPGGPSTLKDPNQEPPKGAVASMIPPITHNPLAIITNGLNTSMGAGPLSGPTPAPHSLWPSDKMKRHVNIVSRISPQSLSGSYNGKHSGQVISEKSVIHERSFQSDRTGHAGRKKGENQRAVHLPELRSHFPEPRGAEGKLCKMTRREQKKDCRIPSISAVDIHSSRAM